MTRGSSLFVRSDDISDKLFRRLNLYMLTLELVTSLDFFLGLADRILSRGSRLIRIYDMIAIQWNGAVGRASKAMPDATLENLYLAFQMLYQAAWFCSVSW